MSEYVVVRGVSEREDGIWYERGRMKVRDKRLDVSGLRHISLAPTGEFETRDDGARAEVCRPMTAPDVAIERAQAWLIDAQGHDLDAVDNLARLGAPSVGLAVASGKLMEALRTENAKDRILAESEISGALADWAAAQDGEEGDHA